MKVNDELRLNGTQMDALAGVQRAMERAEECLVRFRPTAVEVMDPEERKYELRAAITRDSSGRAYPEYILRGARED